MKNLFYLAALLGVTLFSVACHSHDANQTITVNIVSPTDNSTVANASSIVLNILFAASDELHDVDVTLKNEANDSTVYTWEGRHLHAVTYNHVDTLNFSALPSGTELHLEAKGYFEHDGTDGVTAEAHFILP